MTIAKSRVGIVGGSLGGCAAALGLQRAGCDVTVYERAPGALRDRGAGIGLPVPVYDQLVAAGYFDASIEVYRCSERVWIARDGDADMGRVLCRQPILVNCNNWGSLWTSMRGQLQNYREGERITDIADVSADGVSLVGEGARRERFDLVVGADGYRSSLRELVSPGSRPAYAGYVIFRGHYAEETAPELSAAVENGTVQMLVFPAGTGIFYWIPGDDGRIDDGHRRMNWAIYATPPPSVRFDDPTTIYGGAAGGMGEELQALLDRVLEEHLPPAWARVVRHTPAEALIVQPIYDQSMPTYVSGRVMLLGDAATIPRPHTVSGASKALQDALALERAARSEEHHGSWEAVLRAYDQERCAAGNKLVDLGRHLGRMQIEEPPDWSSMSQNDWAEWTKAAFAGPQKSYLYDLKPDAKT